MNKKTRWQIEEAVSWIPAVLIVLAIAAGLYFWLKQDQEPVAETPATVNETEQAVIGPVEPEPIRYPVPETPVPEPAEAASEQIATPEEPTSTPVAEEASEPEPPVEDQFTRLFDWQRFGRLFVLEALINHFVVTVDNMTAAKLPQKFSFTVPPSGKFLIRENADDSKFLDPANYDRYRAFVEFAEAVDINKFVDFYVRHYPLFQKAYEELGYPDRYFNDKFVEVIDHLLLTPVVQGPVELEQPKYYYTFADPKLEELSAGQKIMVRIGPDNMDRVKARLRELRQALTTPKTGN